MPAERLLTDARYLPYLPLIRVAWADGILTEAEVDRIRSVAAVVHKPGIDDEPVLASWLDPDHPPDAWDFQALDRRLRQAARRLPRDERRGLAELGIALARAEQTEPTAPVRGGLRALEDALGVVGDEATRALLDELGVSEPAPAPAPEAPPFDAGDLARLLDGRYHEVRGRVRDLYATGALKLPGERDRDDLRAFTLAQARVLADQGIGALAYPEVMGASEDIGAFIAAFETLAHGDLSLMVKGGVQFGLFGGSLYFLGTERHHALLPDVAALNLPGCYAMTETGHGSNVRELGTTATWDDGGWDLHTPDRAAWKDYIGNAALHGRMAVVFAQLVIRGEGYGVHPLLVPIRDDHGQPLPGVTTQDCGPKMGLNGIDNGRLAFDHVRLPREALLDRYAQVDAEGVYHSAIASPTRRFFTMLGTLVAGRISVACAAVAAARVALATAIRYGAERRQFGPSGAPEQPILDYTAHQRALMPRLARAVALTFALRDLVDRYVNKNEESAREVEALAAALKAVATDFATDTIQACRQACGGAGYLTPMRFADLKADSDVFTTFEGDNTVLRQLAARAVLTAFRDSLGDNRVFGVVRLFGARAQATLAELDPLTPRRTARAHLRSPEFQGDTLQHRLDQLTWSAAGRLRSRMSAGMDGFDAINECQDHLLALSDAYAARHTWR
ncbi:MAG: acyl-CoA dehydrogenase family protein, partial [Alphaproteobacteria bacterium]|nr:acyl-CoA dehydrogenase family protein [Alphaproteobacteria bacterium]